MSCICDIFACIKWSMSFCRYPRTQPGADGQRASSSNRGWQGLQVISHNVYLYACSESADYLILPLYVLTEKDDIWHDALSDSQLVRASESAERGTFPLL